MTSEQIIYIVIASVTLLLIVGLILYRPIKKTIYRKHYRSLYGKELYQIALDNDFYLINDLVLFLDDEQMMHIDHVLFGEKYIYIIKDRYYNGLISGAEKDKKWVLRKRKSQIYPDNPLILNRIRVQKLALITHFKVDLFISIIVVNDDCLTSSFKSDSKANYVVAKSQLKKLIKALESRNIQKINEDQLSFAVKDIARLNANKKNKE